MLPFCPNCSKAISYRARACPYCGEPWPFTGINPILLPVRRFLKKSWNIIKIVGSGFFLIAVIEIAGEIFSNIQESTLLNWFNSTGYFFVYVGLSACATWLFFLMPVEFFLRLILKMDDGKWKIFSSRLEIWALVVWVCVFCYGYIFDGFSGLLN